MDLTKKCGSAGSILSKLEIVLSVKHVFDHSHCVLTFNHQQTLNATNIVTWWDSTDLSRGNRRR